MGGAQRSERDAQFGVGRFECCGGLQGGLDECAAFIVSSDVVRSDQIHQVTFDLVGHHFEDIGQVLALGR